MSYVPYNPNPLGKQSVGDCVIRAVTKAMNIDWEMAYTELCLQGFIMGDMPSSNNVLAAYLIHNGFEDHSLMKKCKDCYTVAEFCDHHKDGIYVLCTGEHVIAVENGSYFDSFNSGNMKPLYYFEKKEG